ncbi:MAG: hypothetical protein MK008_13675 [Bdellovibrionales bacterium]|nr:hypothetical protein [Bdellovibrionales bacterium]
MKNIIKQATYLFIFLIIFIVNIYSFNKLLPETEFASNQNFLAPPEYIHHFSFGYHESLADSFWIRWAQDVDLCVKDKKSRDIFNKENNILQKTFESQSAAVSIELETINVSLSQMPKKDVCDEGWSFLILDAVTNLAPKFKVPYKLGAPTLSVLLEDHMGAKKIFDKGIVLYPDDWSLLYRAAYHYLFELRDLERAADLLKQAADKGAPDWVHSLAARIYTGTGQLELGISTLENYLKMIKHEGRRKEIEERLSRLKKLLKEQKPQDS